MKRVFLSIAALFALGQAIAQTADSSAHSRKLSIDEINLVSSYYQQDGNNAAVTGGIGSEKLTDISNSLDVVLLKYDQKQRKNRFTLGVGIDHYTSASSDMIDLKANSSASHADTRIYPSVSWSRENQAKGSTVFGGLSYSSEFDYQSMGAHVGFAQKSKNKMSEVSARLQAFSDQVKLVKPIELRTETGGTGEEGYGSDSRNTYALSLSYSRIINKEFQLMFLGDVVRQNGLLSLPFHRVYFSDGSVHQETLPADRLKIPLGVRASYFLGDHLIVRTYYRFYTDSWGINSHTADIETPVKISPFLSLSPFYRFYTQSAADYFAPYKVHTASDAFFTSNYDLSKFSSQFYGAGLRFNLKEGLFGIDRLNMLEVRYGHYTKSFGMSANIISLNLRYK